MSKEKTALSLIEIKEYDEFTQDNVGVIGERLAKGIIKHAGGWREFNSLAPEIAALGIEQGFARFESKNDIHSLFEDYKEDLVNFANNLSWGYQADNAYELTLSFLNEKDYDINDIKLAYSADRASASKNIECFNDVAKWVVWNAVQYLFDSYIVYAKWVSEGRPDHTVVPEELLTERENTDLVTDVDVVTGRA